MNKYLIFIIGFLFLASCSSSDSNSKVTSEAPETTSISLNSDQIKNAGIHVDTLITKKLASEINVQGRVNNLPNALAFISLPIAVQIQSIQVRIGDKVNIGQILAYAENINLIEMQENYLRAKTNWELANENFNRQQQLDKSNATSLKAYQQAKATLDEFATQKKSLENQLELVGINSTAISTQHLIKRVAIKSSSSGIVSSINVEKGLLTAPDKPLFSIIDQKQSETQLQVFQQDIAKITIGTIATCIYQGDSLYGEVRAIVPSVDNNNSSIVIVDWKNTSIHPLPGSLLNVQLLCSPVSYSCISKEAVVKWNNKSFVFVQNNNTYEMVEIHLLAQQFNWIGVKAVKENLSGKSIVTKGAYTLLMAIKNAGEEE